MSVALLAGHYASQGLRCAASIAIAMILGFFDREANPPAHNLLCTHPSNIQSAGHEYQPCLINTESVLSRKVAQLLSERVALIEVPLPQCSRRPELIHLHRASTRLSASKLRWPPLSSVKLSFQTPPKATRTCRSKWHGPQHAVKD